jgi:tetratricopeptide (TPR) repeat protein
LELAHPAKVGPLVVTELSATLPGVRFPVDVSGGVPRFRHRRGELQRLEVELGARTLEGYAATRWRGVVGSRAPDVWIGVEKAGATVCVSSAPEPESDDSAGAPVLAFAVQAIAGHGDLQLVVSEARGNGLPAPATAMAIGCVEALLGELADRRGAIFTLRQGPTALARALLPEAGARVPVAEGLDWSLVTADRDTWLVQAIRGAIPAAPTEAAVVARESAALLADADDALMRGDLTAARASCVDALERSPRHLEILRRIAEMDASAGGRAEAALSMLVEARGSDSARLGPLPGELLAETGDTDAAIASFERVGETERAPAVAARAFELAARLARDAQDAASWLDHAVAKSPRATSARWARVERRLELGRLEDALADVEHLEAGARGGRARYRVWMRAGELWQRAGLGQRSATLFERALRFAPDEPPALAGLGAALVREGRAARGTAVLARALEIAERRRDPTSALLLELSMALAEGLDDLPTAIAHASAIPSGAPEAPTARGLEGRWRARLGDLAAAALAFARLRELVSALPLPSSPAEHAVADAAVASLVEAAQLHRDRLSDPLSAQRHLAAALRLRPRDTRLREMYRDAGALVVGHPTNARKSELTEDARPPDDGESFPDEEAESATHRTVTERPPLDLSLAPEPEEDAASAARVEELTRKLQAAPDDDRVANELVGLLEALGRGHELLALLLARLEDATPERRNQLAPQARQALESMAGQAEFAGRLEEAALYRDVIKNLPR